MAKRLSFVEFDTGLKQGKLTPAELRRYLDIDPASAIIRVRFKPGALSDSPPALYDVDREVYLAQRIQQERGLATMLEAAASAPRVLAEGDSWFDLPWWLGRKAIADLLISNGRVAGKNLARWGHTLREIVKDAEFMPEIARFKPDYFIFSAGGNDMQESLARGEFVWPYDATRPVSKCVSDKGEALLLVIAATYRQIMNEIAIRHPDLKCVFFAYDYPRPTFKKGKYIGRHLTSLNYPKDQQDAVAKLIIDRLTDTIRTVVTAFPNANFLDCRQVTATYKFHDDMHPGEPGFQALTRKYEEFFGVAPVAAAIERARPKKAKTKPRAKTRTTRKPAQRRRAA